ncbi:hypothetical protein JI435_417100 [Parastagonospora nodorum SN15]|uniref:Uncharacterized protein n=1 Tax=Phaeosphaeria nodorum (strain SN15 / ATCC MYA-4574 / FGSC 10173) TaxID=321614 RepID=A0A7U2FAG3_PHANO|nr:hypothetical protein JI435_417100 [Parastagonospora nodorum SN15]
MKLSSWQGSAAEREYGRLSWLRRRGPPWCEAGTVQRGAGRGGARFDSSSGGDCLLESVKMTTRRDWVRRWRRCNASRVSNVVTSSRRRRPK